MMCRLTIFLGVFGLSLGSAVAQEVDARAALLASLKAMGGENLHTIEYSGAGFLSRIGQQYSVNGGWPTYQVVDYTRGIDYDAGWSREDYTRQQGDYPTFGRTPMAPEPIAAIVSGAYAWDIRNDEPVALTRPYLDGVAYNELRQLEIAITPHGFLKAAPGRPPPEPGAQLLPVRHREREDKPDGGDAAGA